MNEQSIINMAHLVLKRNEINSLPVPINIIGKSFAEIIIKNIPFDFDGLTLSSNGKTRIYLNSNVSFTRQNFTLAHEIGHVVIPWHTGTIVDTNPSTYTEYDEFESEANLFASELLLPSFIIQPYITKYNLKTLTLKQLCMTLADSAQVSLLVAIFRTFSFINNESFFVISDNSDNVIYTGKTPCAMSVLPKKYSKFDISIYNNDYLVEINRTSDHVFYFLTKKDVVYTVSSDNTDWNETLNEIFDEMNFSKDIRTQYMNSISGVVGAFFSSYGKKISDFNKFRDGLKIRFDGRQELSWLIHNKRFDEFLDRKAMSLFKKHFPVE